MKLSSIKVESFKKVKKTEIKLSAINVLIGSNNAGKSSVLQGIHFSVVASVSARRLGKKTFTQDNLLYCPTRNFVTLRNGAGYQNQSNFGYLRVGAEIGGDEAIYTIRVYRGRNDGNVGCERSGNSIIGLRVTDSTSPFSIYVPGLAGIPQTEEYRSESVVRNGVASGDANVYLRNVIYLIKIKKSLPELSKLMKMIFPNFSALVEFDQTHDIYIDVMIGLDKSGEKKHLELVGTGVLQALQIFSYVTLFKPALLLLDEPDSHLHPDNQALLTEALLTLADETDTKIIISTHSRHIVDSLYGEANFVWLKNGKVFEQGRNLHRLSMLMDIGALDSFEKLREGKSDYVVLTEDSKMEAIKILAKSSGLDVNDIIFYSYKASTNINSAGALTTFLKDIAPETKIIVHADNDFLTDDEQKKLEQKIRNFGAIPFVTEGSDIESYFVSSGHIALLLNMDEGEVEGWLDEIATENHNRLMHKFTRKRDDAKRKYYKKSEDAPDTIVLLGDDIPLPEKKRLGKFMLRKVRARMKDRFGKVVDLIKESDSLVSETLKELV